MLSVNKDSFFFFSNLYTFYFSPASTKMLNRIVKSGHPWLVPNFRRKAFNVSPLNIVLTIDFLKTPFIRLREFFFITSFLRVNGYWVLWKKNFFLHGQMAFLFYCVKINYIDFWRLSLSYILRISPIWSWYIILFIYRWIQFAKILLRIFVSMFIRNTFL